MLTPEQVDEYVAADIIDPIDESWQQAATITAGVCNMLRAILDKITKLGGNDPPQVEAWEVKDFIPLPDSVKQIFEEAKREADKLSGMDVKADHRKRFAGK